MSLPSNLRNLPAEEVEGRQSFVGGYTRSSGRISRNRYDPTLPQGSITAEELTKLGRATLAERQALAQTVRQRLSDRSLTFEERLRIKQDYQQRLTQTEINKQIGEARIRAGATYKDLTMVTPNQKPDTFKMMVDQAKREKQEAFNRSFTGKFLQSITPKPDYRTSKSYGQLYKEGDFPSIVRKGYEDAGIWVQTKISSPITTKLTGTKNTPEQNKALGKMTGEIFLFGSLLPTTSAKGTVQTQESKYVYDATTGKFILKSEQQKYLAEKISRTFDQAYNKEGQIGVAKKLNELIRSTGGKPPKNIENLLVELKNKGYIQGFILNQNTGQLSLLGTPTTTTTTQTAVKPLTLTLNAPQTAQLKYVGLLGASQTPTNILGVRETTKQQARDFNILGTQERSFQGVNLATSTANILSVKTDTKQKQNTNILQGIKQTTGQLQVPKQETIPKTAQRTQQTTTQINLLKQQLRTTKQPQKPRETNKPLIPLPSTTITKAVNFVKKGGDVFDIFAKKKGQDILIGKAKTEKEAFGKLKGLLGTTLRASGFVAKGGKKVKPISFGTDFRPSKKDPFRVVEKKGKRLSTKSEVSEISLFKKKKGKKNKFSWF